MSNTYIYIYIYAVRKLFHCFTPSVIFRSTSSTLLLAHPSPHVGETLAHWFFGRPPNLLPALRFVKPWLFWSPSGWDLFGRSKSRQLKHYNLNQLASSKKKEKLSKTLAYFIIHLLAYSISFCLDAFSISKWASVLFQMSLSVPAQSHDVSWGVHAQGYSGND